MGRLRIFYAPVGKRKSRRARKNWVLILVAQEQGTLANGTLPQVIKQEAHTRAGKAKVHTVCDTVDTLSTHTKLHPSHVSTCCWRYRTIPDGTL